MWFEVYNLLVAWLEKVDKFVETLAIVTLCDGTKIGSGFSFFPLVTTSNKEWTIPELRNMSFWVLCECGFDLYNWKYPHRTTM